jgi:cation transport regulator ChaC
MSFDTQNINKQRQNLDSYEQIWVFGYGSLIHKVDFEYIQRCDACIYDFARRFWQGSHDHRGTVDAPGRVLTLVPSTGERLFGAAFQVNKEVFAHLDHREKNGYLRHEIDIFVSQTDAQPDSAEKKVKGLVYVGEPDNVAYLGEASIEHIAKQIYSSVGPSGANKDYVYALADALRIHNEPDEHVFAVEAALLALEE